MASSTDRAAPLSSAAALDAFLHEQIPLTAAMSLRVLHADGERLRIAAPLQPNRNPHGTVFGGSLATLGIVAGWTLLHRLLQAHAPDAALVIQHYDCDYLAPADREFVAEAHLPDDWPRFIAALREKGRARCEVQVQLSCDERVVLTAKARYAARL